jgi:hypothetical protein
MNKKRHLHIISQENASIGEVTKDIIEGLKNNFIITEESLNEIPEKYDILLCHYVSPAVTQHECFKDFRHKVLIFPVDGTKFIQPYIDSFNSFDLIVTPANAGKDILKQNGVTTKIIVIPNFWKPEHLVEPRFLKQRSLDKEIKGKFVFYYEANYYPRKGYRELLINYIKEFSSNIYKNEVVLLLKTDNSLITYNYFEDLKDEIFEIQKEYKYPAKVVKVSQNIEFEELKKIWNKIDCYVHPARIEGFGIPLLRMAVLNKPIIVLENELSGYNDYLSSYPLTHFVKSNKVIAENEQNKAYSKDSEWSLMNYVDFRNTLRIVYLNYRNNQVRVRCKARILKNSTNYLYINVIKQYVELFNSLNNNNLFIEIKNENSWSKIHLS